jgi:glutathione S-transferase
MAAPQITIGYWGGFKGLGEKVKMFAEYLHIPYTWKCYAVYRGEEWNKDKETLKTDFPNLPYIIDGDSIMTESHALMHYLALKAGREELLGKNTDQKVEIQTILGVLQDIQVYSFTSIRGDLPIKDSWEKQVIPRFEKISKHLGTKQFICGDLTIADFNLFMHCQMHLDLKPDIFDNMPNMKEYFARMSSIPEIAAYLASDRTSPRFLNPVSTEKARTALGTKVS